MQLDQAYKEILNLQQKLHSEYASSASLDEVFNQNLTQEFETDFLNQSIADKHYYSRILSLIYYLKDNKSQLLEPKSLLLQKVSVEKKNIPEIFSIYKEYDDIDLLDTIEDLSTANALTPVLIDLFTYSIIPSLYVMFLEFEAFNSFCDLITKLKEYNDENKIKKIQIDDKEISLHYYFSRSLFVSPMFLKFIRQVMYPFLSPFYNGQLSDYNLDNFIVDTQNKILQSFKKNICFIPSYMKIFFQNMNDTKNFLIECLFNPLCENPEIFLIVDSSITDFETKINVIKNVLKSIFTEKIIENIAKLIDTSKNSEKALFIHEEKKKPILQKTYPKIVNSIDLYVFEKIAKFFDDFRKQENKKPNEGDMINLVDSLNVNNIQIYSSYFENEKIKEKTRIYEQTGVDLRKDYWMHFRKLIKDSLPIPKDYKPPEIEISSKNYKPFLDMIEMLFVNTCDPFTSINAQIVYNIFKDRFIAQLETDGIFSSLDTFRDKMDSLVRTHKEQAEAMEKMSQFRHELYLLNSKKSGSIALMQELYNTIMTNEIQKKSDLEENSAIPKYGIDILSDPIKYKNKFKEYLKKQNEKSMNILGCDCKEIWYHRFYNSLDFYNFCAYRTDLSKYDEITHSGFKRYLSVFLKSNSIESKKVKKVLPCMYLFNDCFKQLNEAFENNYNPLAKLLAMENALGMILQIFQKEFNADEETDRNQLRYIVFSIIDPPRFVSNLVYILEYLVNTGKSIVEHIRLYRLIIPFNIIFNVIHDDTFVNDTLFYLSRPHHKNLDIYITGTNSKSIVKLLKILVASMQGRKPSDEELDKYDELIRNNSKKVFSIFVKFATLAGKVFSNTLDVCALTTIYFGKNIQYTSDSKPEMKIAFYAYQYEKGLLKNKITSETSDFAATKLVLNENKLVFYETKEGINDLKLPNSIRCVSYDNAKESTSIIINKFKLE